MTSPKPFYVYALYRDAECQGAPFYIGKGTGNRWNKSCRCNQKHNPIKHNICVNLIRDHGTVPKRKLFEHLTEADAHAMEVALIRDLGRYPNGPLVNLTDGGEGVSNPSAETRAKMSAIHLGKIISAEARAQMSATRTGRKHPDGTGAKISEANRKRVVTTETKAKIREANLGKKASPEARKKMSEARLGRKHSPEAIARMTAAQNDPERLAQNRASTLGRKRSPETREKMRQAALRRYGHQTPGAESSAGLRSGSPSPP